MTFPPGTGTEMNGTLVKQTAPSAVELVQNWEAKRLLLVIEDRTCRTCGALWNIPGPHVMVEWENVRFKTTKVTARAEHSPAPYGLPQEIRNVKTSCEACPKCFLRDDIRYVFNNMKVDVGSTQELDKIAALDRAIVEDINRAIDLRNERKGKKRGDKGYKERLVLKTKFTISDL